MQKFFYQKHPIKKLINASYKAYSALTMKCHARYRIQDINDKNHKVTVRCSGSRAIIVTHLMAIVGQAKIISGLSPEQACFLGGFYGRALSKNLGGIEAFKKARKLQMLLQNNCGRYKIIYQNRDGEVGYFDQKKQIEYLEHPLDIVNQTSLIMGFDPSQACYLGILAGIELEKKLAKDIARKRQRLYLVK